MPMTCQSTRNHPFPPVNKAILRRRKSTRLVIRLNFHFQFEVALTSKIFEFLSGRRRERGDQQVPHSPPFRQHLTQSTESPPRHPEATSLSPFASHSSVRTAVQATAYGDHVGHPADCFFSCTYRLAMYSLFLYVTVAAFRPGTIEWHTGNRAGARNPPAEKRVGPALGEPLDREK